MRESRREASCCLPCCAPAARVWTQEEYLRARPIEPGCECTPSDSRGDGMLQKDIYSGVFSRLTLVAGFSTPSERLLHPYATRAKTGYERSCCQRPARATTTTHSLLDSTTVVHATVNRRVPGSNPGRAAFVYYRA